MPDALVAILGRVLATGSKSTVLVSLSWFVAVCAAFSILSFTVPAAALLGYAMGGLAILGGLSFLGAYWLFAFKNPEALRSEQFSLKRMAMEKGYFGDDISGYKKIDDAIEISDVAETNDGENEKGGR
jgi:hypothetical protein